MEKVRYDNFNPYVFEAIPCGARVLDVGCASGQLGRQLRAEKDPEFLAGIEIEPSAAGEARKVYDKVAVTNLEELEDLPFARNFFDVVVCADVLEHLKDPASVLRTLTSYLSKKGFFLISVPNTAFVSVRLALLFGRFDYNPAGGILDENHLRFFTRKSLAALLKEAGLEPLFVRGYNLVRPSLFFLEPLGLLFPALFSIQFLAKAVKNAE